MTKFAEPAADFISYLLAELRVAALRAGLDAADIEAISLALKGALINTDQALSLLD